MNEQQALYKDCLRMGDNALIQSYRLSEWCSNVPLLEEDLALTNFALDMIGRAQSLLTYAAKVDGSEKTDDDLAYRRGERDYYNHLMAELPNGDFAFTIVKLLFSSSFEFYFFTELQKSADATLAAIATKTLKEVKYHKAHATDWVLRLGDGTEESHHRAQRAVNELWLYKGELFQTEAEDALLADKNIAVDMVPVEEKWIEYVSSVLSAATLEIPETDFTHTGSQQGVHTEYLGHILSEMQYLPRAYPDAKW